jgi:DnaK suppressor protein
VKTPKKAGAAATKVAAKAVAPKKTASSKKTSAPVGRASAKAAAPKPVKSAAVKPAAKGKAIAKTATKAAAKTAAKPVKKPVAAPVKSKAVAKAVVKAAVPRPAAKPAIPAPPKAAGKAPASKAKVAAPAAPVVAPKAAAPAVAAAPAAPSDQPVRATRPSARLAQITVPSLPPAVASTAAKSSFLPPMPATSVISAPVSSVKKDPKLANNWKTKSLEQLSDAELMAMPDSEYMNDVQMAYFRRKLVMLKQDILANAGETTEHLREDTVVVPDPADRATIEEEHALELRTRDRERKLLKKIEQSIARIDAGDYGYCDETGEPIGVGRLLARPTATLSLEAQQRRELKQKMFGD